MNRQPRSMMHIPIKPRGASSSVPLSTIQEEIWRSVYHDGVAINGRTSCASVYYRGALNFDLLQRCLDIVVSRHEALRTRIAVSDGTPRQQIDDSAEIRLRTVEMTGTPMDTYQSQVDIVAAELLKETVDLSVGPLVAAKLINFSEHDHVLVCALDHSISDATSVDLLLTEISALYRRIAHGILDPLPPTCLQFGDYATWQRETYSAWLREHADYWKQRLAGAPKLRLPCGSAWKYIDGVDSQVFQFSFGRSLTEGLRSRAKNERVPLSLIICALYVAVTFRWCAQEEAVVRVVTNGRFRPELRSIIGRLACLPNLRITVQSSERFSSLLRKLALEFESALRHLDFGIIPDIVPEWTLDATDAYFNWLPPYRGLNQPPIKEDVWPHCNLSIQLRRFHWPASYAFIPIFADTGAEIRLIVHHISETFPRVVVESFTDNLRLFAEQFVHDADARIGRYQT